MNQAAKAESPFTGAISSEVWGRRDGRLIFRCPDTGAVFFDRATLTPETYAGYYPYLRAFDAARSDWELAIRRRKFRCQLHLMGRYTTSRTLVDVGAGPGYFCRIAWEEGWNATGVEISTEAVRHGEARFQVRYSSLDEIKDESVDALTCFHVLEHVMTPPDFLKTVHRKLKPRGLLALHVPHQKPLTFKARDFLSRWTNPQRDTWCCLYGNIHVSGFTVPSLRKLVERAGFDTHFVRSAGMWSKFYDPFFTMNYVRNRAWVELMKQGVRHTVETVGVPFGCGDWLVGYFARRS